MGVVVKTAKLHIHLKAEDIPAVKELTEMYCQGCNYVSKYVFNSSFDLTFLSLNEACYHNLREQYGLKSQFAQSVSKTVIARYKTVKEQLLQKPYKYKLEDNKWLHVTRTLEWLQNPILFGRPQADLVRGRDYSFVMDKKTGVMMLSLNTLKGRIIASYDVPKCFKEYFDRSCANPWSFGTGKIVSLNGEWYFHIPMTKEIPDTFDREAPSHVVGIDRGLRFLAAAYDEKGKTIFFSGQDILKKKSTFNDIRAELQSKGTKSAKRALKRISGRENRWMADVNHQLSKTLVDAYGPGTLFTIEDLTDVSFSDDNLGKRSKAGRNELRSWTFYQLEQFLTYKARFSGSDVVKVDAHYTSQRCPKCGRIHKENRNHDKHLYVCDCCGYRSNDDRVGAMNIYMLGTMYISGDNHPRYGKRKEK